LAKDSQPRRVVRSLAPSIPPPVQASLPPSSRLFRADTTPATHWKSTAHGEWERCKETPVRRPCAWRSRDPSSGARSGRSLCGRGRLGGRQARRGAARSVTTRALSEEEIMLVAMTAMAAVLLVFAGQARSSTAVCCSLLGARSHCEAQEPLDRSFS